MSGRPPVHEMTTSKSKADFRDTQLLWTAHMRDPLVNPPPADIEERRLLIYRDLIFNNIESFLSGGFPILHSILSEADWQALVRGFIIKHECHSPYFLEISQEFLSYLNEQSPPELSGLPFALELAHYEWVELALDVSTEDFPADSASVDEELLAGTQLDDMLLDKPVLISPLAWRLCYQFPVHKIGPEFQPEIIPDEPTYLLVYRNRNEAVQFLESNAVTIRLLQLLEGGGCSARQALVQIAEEIGRPDINTVVSSGLAILKQLVSLSIVCMIDRHTN